MSAVMAGPYGHPFHPLLVHVPIGAWICSLVFDIASRAAPDSGFLPRASEWLIAIGVLGALAAASVGFLDLLAIPSRTRAFRVGLVHMSLNLTVTVAYAVNFGWRHGMVDRDGRVPIGPLVLSVLSVLTLAAAGYLGGMLTFRYGVRVADEVTQAEGFREPTWSPPRVRHEAEKDR